MHVLMMALQHKVDGGNSSGPLHDTMWLCAGGSALEKAKEDQKILEWAGRAKKHPW